ncbi:MAG: putative quinol monooxygenase [Acidimicrobiales bacterium]
MSVLVVMTVPGDTATFEAFVAANSDLVMDLTEKAKAGGCRRHRFGIGDGEILVVDEWDTAEQFEAFISTPEIQGVMGQMGAQGDPRITFADAKGFPGEF